MDAFDDIPTEEFPELGETDETTVELQEPAFDTLDPPESKNGPPG